MRTNLNILMVDRPIEIPKNARLRSYLVRRRLLAGLSTSCACFILLTLIWPLSVSGFRSHASVKIRLSNPKVANDDIQISLTRSLAQGTEDLQDLLQQVGRQQPLSSPLLTEPNDGNILNALSVGYQPFAEGDEELHLELAFEGEGTADERLLVRLLARKIAMGFLAETEAIDVRASGETAFSGTASSESELLSQLEWLANQVESDLLAIQRSLVESELDQTQASLFRNASHANGSAATLESVQQALSSIDTSAMKVCLSEFRELKRQRVKHELENLSSMSVQIKTLPVGGVPAFYQVVALGAVALLLGAFIATRYQPFHETGFASVSQVASLLRTPVVAALPTKFGETKDREPAMPTANLIVHVCVLTLLCLAVAISGFCLINEDVRSAFLTNPFHGLSRIVWMFVGS